MRGLIGAFEMSIGMVSNRIARFTSALNAYVANALFAMLCAYLVYRHWHTVNIYEICLMLLPVGINLWGQFRRARKIIDSNKSMSETSQDAVYHLLFLSAINNLLLLVFIAALLRHFEGFI